MRRLFTSESVSEGHPDKICDQISDVILDAYLKIDQNAHVACETFICQRKILVSGEVRVHYRDNNKLTSPKIEVLIRNLLKEIGYDSETKSIDYRTIPIEILLHEQSRELDKLVHEGAGDQGMMFGYAIQEPNIAPKITAYMPLPIIIAHKIIEVATSLRKKKRFNAYPDMKAQVTVAYDEHDNVIDVDSLVFSYHCPVKSSERFIIKEIFKPTLQYFNLNLPPVQKLFITPFHIGSIAADTGLTGRKIMVDTYGGWSRHGGGAFSGKDATKVDRSGAYMARYMAKNIVAAGLAKKCEIQLAYVVGHKQPISIYVDTFKTGIISDEMLVKEISKHFQPTPNNIIEQLNLRRPGYLQTSVLGHFGKKNDFFT